jgi:hypothetical protein
MPTRAGPASSPVFIRSRAFASETNKSHNKRAGNNACTEDRSTDDLSAQAVNIDNKFGDAAAEIHSCNSACRCQKHEVPKERYHEQRGNYYGTDDGSGDESGVDLFVHESLLLPLIVEKSGCPGTIIARVSNWKYELGFDFGRRWPLHPGVLQWAIPNGPTATYV